MKKRLIFIFLTFKLLPSFGQQSDSLENLLYTCIVQSFQEQEIDLSKQLDYFEKQMILKGVLDAKDGASYYKLYQKLAANGDKVFDIDPDFYKKITRVHPMDYYSPACISKVIQLDSNILMNSKTYRLARDFEEFKSMKYISVSMVAEKITDVLDPSDFKHPYYRATALLSMANICKIEQGIEGLTKENESQAEKWDDMIKLSIQINENNQIIIADSLVKHSELKRITTEFILQNDSNHVIRLNTTRGTTYDFYIRTQEIIHKAYDEVRNHRSMDLYNKPFEELSAEKRSNIKKLYPFRLKES